MSGARYDLPRFGEEGVVVDAGAIEAELARYVPPGFRDEDLRRELARTRTDLLQAFRILEERRLRIEALEDELADTVTNSGECAAAMIRAEAALENTLAALARFRDREESDVARIGVLTTALEEEAARRTRAEAALDWIQAASFGVFERHVDAGVLAGLVTSIKGRILAWRRGA